MGRLARDIGAWGIRPGKVGRVDAYKGRMHTEQGSWRKAWDRVPGAG